MTAPTDTWPENHRWAAIGNNGCVQILCDVTGRDGNVIEFVVENGGWRGSLRTDTRRLAVDNVEDTAFDVEVLWSGERWPESCHDHNDAISAIQKLVDAKVPA